MVVSDILEELREACARIAGAARHVRVHEAAIPAYAARLPVAEAPPDAAGPHLEGTDRDTLAAFWITLDAINFGSGWFPTLRKPAGRSGYFTIASALRDRFVDGGPWSARELADMERHEIALALGQDPGHELMGLFALSLRDLGRRLCDGYGGSFLALAQSAGRSATALVERLAGWSCFADRSEWNGVAVPFLKRAQIAAADLHRAEVVRFGDLHRLTMFADNLVPHVLRLDGVLGYEPALLQRIEQGELLEHGSREEVEIRASAVHAVEQIVAARPGAYAAQIDQVLWLRGQERRYKASPRHRTRCTAY